jgi:hypothetical protein
MVKFSDAGHRRSVILVLTCVTDPKGPRFAIGSLDHPDAARSEMHWGIDSQVPWLALHNDLPPGIGNP